MLTFFPKLHDLIKQVIRYVVCAQPSRLTNSSATDIEIDLIIIQAIVDYVIQDELFLHSAVWICCCENKPTCQYIIQC